MTNAAVQYDVIIIGAGAAGMMCAIEAGKRKRNVLLLDHANKPGKKILMSGGGRCNFTNYHISPDNYISHNPHFCKSALSRYTQWDFIKLVEKHNIPYHEKTLGQLFCDNKAKDIVNMLLAECTQANVTLLLKTGIDAIQKIADNDFIIETSTQKYRCQSVVIATGGLSIPTMGASPFAYKIAEQFGIKVWPTRAGLVPFTLQEKHKQRFAPLSGIALASLLSNERTQFKDQLLFTHRGLSGPAVLQISSYWQNAETIQIRLLPDLNLYEELLKQKQASPNSNLGTCLNRFFPKRVAPVFIDDNLLDTRLQQLKNHQLQQVADCFQHWALKPNGTEGYRTAEVTLGGVDCDALSSKTMEVNGVAGLYFVGEAVDVSGWLGGFNFQWAWASGVAAAQGV